MPKKTKSKTKSMNKERTTGADKAFSKKVKQYNKSKMKKK